MKPRMIQHIMTTMSRVRIPMRFSWVNFDNFLSMGSRNWRLAAGRNWRKCMTESVLFGWSFMVECGLAQVSMLVVHVGVDTIQIAQRGENWEF